MTRERSYLPHGTELRRIVELLGCAVLKAVEKEGMIGGWPNPTSKARMHSRD